MLHVTYHVTLPLATLGNCRGVWVFVLSFHLISALRGEE